MSGPFARFSARLLAAALAACFAATLAALSAARAETAAPRVVASIAPIHSLVAAITEGVATPTLLIPATASPHTFSLRPSDARSLAQADLIVWVGPMLETSLTGSLAALAARERLLTLTETPAMALHTVREGGVWDDAHAHGQHAHDEHVRDAHADSHQKESQHGESAHGHGEKSPHSAGEIDGHLWLDTRNARVIVDTVATALIARDPAHAAAYRANRDATLAQIDTLTARLAAILVPARNEPYVVLHDGFQYFERQFDLNGAGAVYISPDLPPGARRLGELRRHIDAVGARCVFGEPQLRDSLVRTLAKTTGARIGRLDPIGIDLPAGPALYPTLMEHLGTDFAACFADRVEVPAR